MTQSLPLPPPLNRFHPLKVPRLQHYHAWNWVSSHRHLWWTNSGGDLFTTTWHPISQQGATEQKSSAAKPGLITCCPSQAWLSQFQCLGLSDDMSSGVVQRQSKPELVSLQMSRFWFHCDYESHAEEGEYLFLENSKPLVCPSWHRPSIRSCVEGEALVTVGLGCRNHTGLQATLSRVWGLMAEWKWFLQPWLP